MARGRLNSKVAILAIQFGFDGYAGTTLLFLTDIYKNGGAHVVEEIFTHIKKGRYTYGDALKSNGVN